MPATPIMSRNIADKASIDRAPLPKGDSIDESNSISPMPANTPIEGMATATAAATTAANATQTLLLSGAANVAATSTPSARSR